MRRQIKNLWNRALGFWSNFKKEKFGVFGLAIFIFFIFLAVFAPYLSPYAPFDFSHAALSPPDLQNNILGTNEIGGDLLSQIIWGTRVSMAFGLASAAISLTVGLTLGALAGYYGGIVDLVLSKIFELFMMMPALFLMIVAVSIIGTNLYITILIIGITSWPSNARIARTQVISLKQRGFVQSAVGLGASHFRILFRHIIPNGLYPILANATLQVGNAIIMEAGLSFLGLGDPNQISWGQILYRGQFVYSMGWWLAIFPGIMISLAALSFNVMGDALNTALKPKLR